MTKLWFDGDGKITDENAYAFPSRKAANRAMYEDWTQAYDGRPDKDQPDSDRFWESQVAPSVVDMDASLEFRDRSKIDWHIHECEVET